LIFTTTLPSPDAARTYLFEGMRPFQPDITDKSVSSDMFTQISRSFVIADFEFRFTGEGEIGTVGRNAILGGRFLGRCFARARYDGHGSRTWRNGGEVIGTLRQYNIIYCRQYYTTILYIV